MITSSFDADTSASLPGPEWLRAARAQISSSIESLVLPDAGEEVWRYSRINDFTLEKYSPSTEIASGSPDALPRGVSNLIDAIGSGAALVVTHNGRIIHWDVDNILIGKGLRVVGPEQWPDGDGFGSVAKPVDAFGELNQAFVTEPILIDIPEGLYVESPIVVVHWVSGDGSASFPRVTVRAGAASEATICECLGGEDVDALVAPVTELEVGAAANIRYVNVQTLGPRTWQVAYQASRIERDATFVSSSVALGGYYARVRTDSRLNGAGATARLNALYFGAEDQMHDFRTLQAHDAPKTTSDLLFKGAVGNVARSVYSGLIRVQKGASGTNAFQTNRNLVLSDGAHADSVPNLEIEENDVHCSHASAVGPIDEDQRYYLESRGVPPDIAERLIVLGFLDEIVSALSVSGLKPFLRRLVSEKLDRLSATGARKP